MAFRICFACLLGFVACGNDLPIGIEASDAASSGDTAASVLADAPDRVATDAVVDTAPEVAPNPCFGVPCDDSNPCTQDSCTAGQCVHIAILGPCDDHNACTLGDACTDGVCLPGLVTDCTDGVACTTDTCNPISGCVSVPANGPCDDGKLCTVDACTMNGCTHTANALPCDDGDACTLADACTGETCVGSKANCDDGDPCTADACLSASGCVHNVGTCGNGVCDCGEATATCASDCPSPCGNGVCDGLETVVTCPADCAVLAARTAGPCNVPGKWDICAYGYICVARSVQAGGNICVADFETWGILSDARPLTDYVEHADYVTDLRTQLDWAKASLPPMSFEVALSACTTQTYGGFDDWRVPTFAELVSLVDGTIALPAARAPGLSWFSASVYEWDYWSGVGYWVVGFDGGEAANGLAMSGVRCVRGPATTKALPGAGSRYAALDNGLVILDRVTGLRWQEPGPTQFTGKGDYWPFGFNWQDAMAFCAQNTEALPGAGWRLPTVRELWTIHDRKPFMVQLDPIFKPCSSNFWSSTLMSLDQSWAWMIGFGYGSSIGAIDPKDKIAVRCVR